MVSSHFVRTGPHTWAGEGTPDPDEHQSQIEPWLTALVQSDHLNLLIGSGFSHAAALLCGAAPTSMSPASLLGSQLSKAVEEAAIRAALRCGRGASNIEDQIRCVRQLIDGLSVLTAPIDSPDPDSEALYDQLQSLCDEWRTRLDDILSTMLHSILQLEQAISNALDSEEHEARRVEALLGSFLLSFASRTSGRERLHLFTTNYDRLIERTCERVGLRIVDRFVGSIEPRFRSSRLAVDLHYNPPGIRGEPRFLEGVVRMTKLHGSIDWRCQPQPLGSQEIFRCALPFGASDDHPSIPHTPSDALMIYPNPAKDVETLEYPYADLFRDFAAATCLPNSVLFTYGYGFGDDHINRAIIDMLTLPSTHLAILAYDDAGGRIPDFCERVGREAQISVLSGSHFGDLATLVDHYLPKPAIDNTTLRMFDLLRRREMSRDRVPDEAAEDAD